MEKYLEGISTLGQFALSVILAIGLWKSRKKKETIEESEAKAEIDMKLKELEGRINTQYGELKASILALEKTVADSKSSNYAFETRLLASIDKLDTRLERTQDLVLKSIIKNQEQ